MRIGTTETRFFFTTSSKSRLGLLLLFLGLCTNCASPDTVVQERDTAKLPWPKHWVCCRGAVDRPELDKSLVIVDFWEPDCRPCIAALPHIERLSSRYFRMGVQVVGISTDSPERIGEVVRDLRLSFPTGIDTGRRLSDTLSVDAWPETVVIDENRAVVPEGASSTVEREILQRIGLPADVQGLLNVLILGKKAGVAREFCWERLAMIAPITFDIREWATSEGLRMPRPTTGSTDQPHVNYSDAEMAQALSSCIRSEASPLPLLVNSSFSEFPLRSWARSETTSRSKFDKAESEGWTSMGRLAGLVEMLAIRDIEDSLADSARESPALLKYCAAAVPVKEATLRRVTLAMQLIAEGGCTSEVAAWKEVSPHGLEYSTEPKRALKGIILAGETYDLESGQWKRRLLAEEISVLRQLLSGGRVKADSILLDADMYATQARQRRNE